MNRPDIAKPQKIIRGIVHALTIRRSALDRRPPQWQGPSRRYASYVILGHQRSGTTMLTRALRKHPQLVCFGELFVAGRIGFNVEGFNNQAADLLYLRKRHPREFLERYVFASYPNHIRAVGFKLFPDQIDNRDFGCVKSWLMRYKALRIIRLQRRNLLATYVSLLIAAKTGTFGITSEADRPSVTVTIDPAKCLDEFRRRKRYQELARQWTSEHDVLEIAYEDLAKDPPACLCQIQSFLKTDVLPLEVETVKKEIRPLSQVIVNYDEMRRYFRGSEWAPYFDGQ